MSIRRLAGCSIVMLVFVNGVFAASADLADAVMRRLMSMRRKVTAPQHFIGPRAWTTWRWQTC